MVKPRSEPALDVALAALVLALIGTGSLGAATTWQLWTWNYPITGWVVLVATIAAMLGEVLLLWRAAP